MRNLLALVFIVLTGCTTASKDKNDLNRINHAIRFTIVNSPNLSEYQQHWIYGTQSAWFSRSNGNVLILDTRTNVSLQISDFPKEFGRITATGWEKDNRFFVHVTRGADMGTMIYFDIPKKEVVEVKNWSGY